jgi:uncharacterized protein YkwD
MRSNPPATEVTMRTSRHPRHPAIVGWLCLAAALAAPAAAAGATPAERSAQDAVLGRVNAVRAAHHLAPLRRSALLTRPARHQGGFVARTGRLQHESADGSPFSERLYRAGFSRRKAVGENLGMVGGCAPRAAGEIVRMWLRSAPHRRALLSRAYRVVGIGVVAAADCSNTAFVADFGG